MKCTIHPHSSDESAKACFAKRIGKRGDKRLESLGMMTTPKYRQMHHQPPLIEIKSHIKIFIFFSGQQYK